MSSTLATIIVELEVTLTGDYSVISHGLAESGAMEEYMDDIVVSEARINGIDILAGDTSNFPDNILSAIGDSAAQEALFAEAR